MKRGELTAQFRSAIIMIGTKERTRERRGDCALLTVSLDEIASLGVLDEPKPLDKGLVTLRIVVHVCLLSA